MHDQERTSAGAVVLEAVRALGIKYGHERSFKLSAGALLPQRFLLGFRKQRIAQDPDERILAVCERLGMPATLLARYRASLPESNYVHFGFEAGAGGGVCKAYLEFFDRVAALMRRPGGVQPAYLMHLGFKWQANSTGRAVVTRYDWYPFLPLEALLARVAALLPDPPQATLRSIAERMVHAAARRVPAQDIFLLEAIEEGNPRRSFDINFYRAGMRMADVAPLLAEAGEHYGVSDALAGLCRRVADQAFGHVSGGVDRDGRDFMTVYHGIEYVTPNA